MLPGNFSAAGTAVVGWWCHIRHSHLSLQGYGKLLKSRHFTAPRASNGKGKCWIGRHQPTIVTPAAQKMPGMIRAMFDFQYSLSEADWAILIFVTLGLPFVRLLRDAHLSAL